MNCYQADKLNSFASDICGDQTFYFAPNKLHPFFALVNNTEDVQYVKKNGLD